MLCGKQFKMESDYIKISRKSTSEKRDAKSLRIVHISDTHLLHEDLLHDRKIPQGDVIVHSGDFSFFRFKRHCYSEYDYQEEIDRINQFFSQLPHKYKIFVAGNHETNFPAKGAQQIKADLSDDVIYLEDDSIEIEGLKFYGSPWCGRRWYSFARSYVIPYENLKYKWQSIPSDVDVLVTHSPPGGVLDLAEVQPWQNLWQAAKSCELCGNLHEGFKHFGCPYLLQKVYSIKPLVHMFGHVHECNRLETTQDIVFSNAAMKLSGNPHIIDIV